ncbi:unnamed protein product [Mytilus coruscus]|uniref:C2H2-type domain-containing protein n=1 Tax=Mytilus coruscus TaxID=42192 RepID=A0A6J8CC98_MYTCO|nr:unnamed protein product [Mytilus coruscus]
MLCVTGTIVETRNQGLQLHGCKELHHKEEKEKQLFVQPEEDGGVAMEESQVLTDIINCFTSIDQLLTFAHTYGLEDDPTVQLRFAHLRRQTSPLHIKCHTCGEFFRDQQKYDLHVVYHETIRDFDLNVFDEPHSVSNHAQTINPRKRKTSSLVSSTDTTQGPPPTKKKASVSQNQYGAGVDTPSTHKISKKRERTYTKNGALDTTYDVKFSDKLQNKKLMDIVNDLHKIFDDVLGQVREGSQDNSLDLSSNTMS